MREFSGIAIAIAWPQFKGKQTGSWYDKPMSWLGFNRNSQYKVGHAAMILVDCATGKCNHFDCGRYHAPFQHGRIRDETTDANLAITTKAIISDYKITNIKNLLTEVQENKSSKGVGNLHASYCAVNFELALTNIKNIQSKGIIPFGPFVINGINCCRFVRSGILGGMPSMKYKLRLRYLWPLKPMPISNVQCLSNKIIIPKVEANNIHKPIENHSILSTKYNLKGTLLAPSKPKNISINSQWLSGEVAGSWFSLASFDQEYIISRYSPEGDLECAGKFKLSGSENFNLKEPYSFTHLSHCNQANIIQNHQLFQFNRV
jgi:hypothetical protein